MVKRAPRGTLRLMATQDFRDLKAWIVAVELAACCEDIIAALPRSRWKLRDQIATAADSVHCNIAEGNGKPTRADYIKFLWIAHASLQELESRMIVVRRRLLRRGETKRVFQLIIMTGKLLTALIKSLE